ncbi:crotonase/enoyl-CoA hydratase family protein [Leptospira sp. GIMC2001]|uniref:crotonase/enoyl-CoA hydratase family protein n=1 Tax=Leptospira sp. GIMC2001 TaxID=1513297 RepID=UPI002349A958|nr:crotonase/enoyl-CoA hydratase family protein [Leptospira sp. GIMC2001]WCL48160.1 crotonase/enoyl-CoA hydratase family protein [Leptospira sp. GIMC2001]
MKTKFEFFEIEQEDAVATVYLNKPEKRNAMDWSFWRDLPEVVAEINAEKSIRAFIIAGRGKSFSTGLDLSQFFQEFKGVFQGEIADHREKLYKLIIDMQKGLNEVQNSPKPSIIAVHKHCIGGGLDLMACGDIRYCTTDAMISLREAKVAIVADMGSLNRLPGIIGQGHTRELALTGKDISGEEALQMGLVTKVFDNYEDLIVGAKKTAKEIADNPALVIRGVKAVMNYCMDKSVNDGLQFVAAWNTGFLDSHDFREIITAFHEKKRPVFNSLEK